MVGSYLRQLGLSFMSAAGRGPLGPWAEFGRWHGLPVSCEKRVGVPAAACGARGRAGWARQVARSGR